MKPVRASATICHLAIWLAACLVAAAPARALDGGTPKPSATAAPLALHPADKPHVRHRKLARRIPGALAPAARATTTVERTPPPGDAPSTLSAQTAPIPNPANGGGPTATDASPAGAKPADPRAAAGGKPPVANASAAKPTAEGKPAPATKAGIPAIVSMPPASTEPKNAAAPQAGAANTKVALAQPPQGGDAQTEAQQYCANIAPTAADARFAWETKRLTDLDAQLKQRIAELDAKQAEYKEWLQKRQDLEQKATAAVVAIYANMRPESAAGQLAVMDDATATAILMKLNARTASAILNEMDSGRAAKLTDAIATYPTNEQGGKKP